MASHWIRAALAGAVSLIATTAMAMHDPALVVLRPVPPDPATATPVSPLTVQGPQTPEVLQKESYSFVQVYAAPTAMIGQIARWHEALCIELVGLPQDEHDKLVARIEEVAKSVKLRILGPGCSANLQIEFTDTPQRFLDKVANIAEPLLGYHYPSDLQKLKTVTHPIQGWYATASSGDGIGTAGVLWSGGDGGAGKNGKSLMMSFAPISGLQRGLEGLDTPDHHAPMSCGNNPNVTACLSSRFAHVLIVADNNAIAGKDFAAVADYVTMLALSQPKSLDSCNALPSTIDLFATTGCTGRGSPAGLTPADTSYLDGLYGTDAEEKLHASQSDIANHMARILIKASAKERLAATSDGTSSAAGK